MERKTSFLCPVWAFKMSCIGEKVAPRWIRSHRGLLAIEVKSGRVKRMGRLERFCQRYQEAQPVVMDLEKGARFLDGGDVVAFLKKSSRLVFRVASFCKWPNVKDAKNVLAKNLRHP